ncbi:hypothetical protein Tco_0910350 [Tanacetum coccineum]|uniref:Uncharacterized protein n=1 Tax=Tanacetum coccineum TaxID=301880 RepID=A0ABQ5CSM3_9ASTR
MVWIFYTVEGISWLQQEKTRLILSPFIISLVPPGQEGRQTIDNSYQPGPPDKMCSFSRKAIFVTSRFPISLQILYLKNINKPTTTIPAVENNKGSSTEARYKKLKLSILFVHGYKKIGEVNAQEEGMIEESIAETVIARLGNHFVFSRCLTTLMISTQGQKGSLIQIIQKKSTSRKALTNTTLADMFNESPFLRIGLISMSQKDMKEICSMASIKQALEGDMRNQLKSKLVTTGYRFGPVNELTVDEF